MLPLTLKGHLFFPLAFPPFLIARRSVLEGRSGTRKQESFKFNLPSVPSVGKGGRGARGAHQLQEPGFTGIAWTRHDSDLPSSLLWLPSPGAVVGGRSHRTNCQAGEEATGAGAFPSCYLNRQLGSELSLWKASMDFIFHKAVFWRGVLAT